VSLGIAQADKRTSCVKLIKSQGLNQSIGNHASKTGKAPSTQAHQGQRSCASFPRQLSTLINAGLPLVQKSRGVADQQTTNKPSLKVVITQVLADVEGGKPLKRRGLEALRECSTKCILALLRTKGNFLAISTMA